jgi:septum formation protein
LNSVKPRLILASGSPRRRELLARAGYPFTVITSDVPEVRRSNESPLAYTRRLARSKAEAVLARVANAEPDLEAAVLGADTTVAITYDRVEHVLEKPADAEDARRMLLLLSGNVHEVYTAVCIATRDRLRHVRVDLQHACTHVHFRPLTDAEIDSYIATGEPFDKAGGYGIQGKASPFIARYDGDYDNVVGLPLFLVHQMLGDPAHYTD